MLKRAGRDREQESGLLGFVSLILEHWRVLGTAVVVSVVGSGLGMWLLIPRQYEARMTLATVTSVGASQLPSGLAAFTGMTGVESLQLTPDLIAWLAVSRRVLLEVGRSSAPDDAGRSLVSSVAGRDMDAERPRRVERTLRDILDVSVDRRVGLINISATHRDSALARVVLDRVVAAAGRAFTETARAQATEQRKGQEARVDVTGRQLAHAEGALVEFLSANRVITQFSPLTVERQRLERVIQVAQQAYIQAANEREEAVARELEQTPALVSVDSPPSILPRAPRFIAIRGVAAGLAVGIFVLSIIVLRDVLRQKIESGDEVGERLINAISGVPVVRRVLLGRRIHADDSVTRPGHPGSRDDKISAIEGAG